MAAPAGEWSSTGQRERSSAHHRTGSAGSDEGHIVLSFVPDGRANSYGEVTEHPELQEYSLAAGRSSRAAADDERPTTPLARPTHGAHTSLPSLSPGASATSDVGREEEAAAVGPAPDATALRARCGDVWYRRCRAQSQVAWAACAAAATTRTRRQTVRCARARMLLRALTLCVTTRAR